MRQGWQRNWRKTFARSVFALQKLPILHMRAKLTREGRGSLASSLRSITQQQRQRMQQLISRLLSPPGRRFLYGNGREREPEPSESDHPLVGEQISFTRAPSITPREDGRCLAVFTSGGDAQGMNSALRAVVRMAIFIFSSFLFLPSV